MSTILRKTIWAIALLMSVATLTLISSCSDDGGDDPDPEVIKPSFSYTATDVELGSTMDIVPAAQGDLPIAWSIIDDGGTADFVSIDAATGTLSAAAESVIGEYTVKVKAENTGGSSEADADINITISSEFDPRGLSLYWKYFMNNTADVTISSLDLLDESLPPQLTLPTGWPAGWDTGAINPADPALPTYFVFTGIQESILQVPGDDACLAYVEAEEDSVYHGDTLVVIVNQDLTLSTVCRKKSDENTTVTTEIGTSTISYADGGFVWTLNVVLQGILPLQIAISDAAIVSNYLDPLHPHYSAPSGQGGMYNAVTGTVPSYQTVDDYGFLATGGLPSNFIYLDVDVVLEIMAE